MDTSLCIMQVSTADMLGGAEKISLNLSRAYRELGFRSWCAVGRKFSHDPDVFLIPNDAYRGHWASVCATVGNLFLRSPRRSRTANLARTLLEYLGEPRRRWRILNGFEDFDFPGTRHLLELTSERPDIVHCHNLHGDFFDLRALPWLSQQVPVVVTLHDAWLLSGHCAHSFECTRWQTGCGHCPDLTIYPSIRRDETARNWRIKQGIFERSRLYVCTPCWWLMHRVEQSILARAIVAARVIPNGVDLAVFSPGDQERARTSLGIPLHANVMLSVGNRIRANPWKDYPTMENAVRQVADRMPDRDFLLLCLGEEGGTERIGHAQVRFVGYETDPAIVAEYYRAADIYVHAALADTFPNTILEALACGLPVVATAVGGVQEQVKGLEAIERALGHPNCNKFPAENATGVLVMPKDAKGIATALGRLLSDDVLRRQLGKNAAHDARERFDLRHQANAYLQWYQEIVECRNT